MPGTVLGCVVKKHSSSGPTKANRNVLRGLVRNVFDRTGDVLKER